MSHADRREVLVGGASRSSLYSQGLIVGSIVYLSGVTGVDPTTGHLVGGTVADRTEQILKNIRAILEAAGSRMDKIIRVNIFLTSMEDYSLMNEAYLGAFNYEIKPVRTCVAVKELPRGTDIEIEVTASL